MPEAALIILNRVLRKQIFLLEWKSSKLVLIHKSGKTPGDTNAYRPLCLEDSMAKLYEHMIKKRLEDELEGLGGLK